MLSQTQEVKACYRRNEWPALDEPINVRVCFQKVGDLQFISHLDLQRTLHRILVRAGIPMWYTKGFNPHAKIVFSTPLSVGTQSVCEMVDIRIDRDMPCETIKALLNNEVTDELRILDVYVPQTKFSDIAWAEYEIEFHEQGIEDKIRDIDQFTSQTEIKTIKKTKSGEKEIDILPMIHTFAASVSKPGCVAIRAILRAGNDTHLNPELPITVLKEKLGILASPDSWYTIMRKATYLEDGNTRFR